MVSPGDEVFAVYVPYGFSMQVERVYATEGDALRAKMDDLDDGNLAEEELKEWAKQFIKSFEVKTY